MPQGQPILCVVGLSDSGKTALMEDLIRELSKRGYRVATIKHAHHAIEPDQPGKDSWRHRQAGAVLSIVSSRRAVGAFMNVESELTVEELQDRFIRDVDLILIEGYKDGRYPKIVVVGGGDWDPTSLSEIKAVVSSRPEPAGQPSIPNVPVFRPNDITGIARFIEQTFLGNRKARKEKVTHHLRK